MYNLNRYVGRESTCAKKTCKKIIKKALNLPYFDDSIPLWVADMDFACAPEIIDAIKKRADQGILGYTALSDSYYQSIISWYQRRHNMQIEKEWLIYSLGTVEAICNTIKAFSDEGDGVIIQPPVYPPFSSSVIHAKRKLINNTLMEENGVYRIDFDDFEQACAKESNKIFILCNPHNPVGHVWSKEDVTKMAKICVKHNVVVFADEIHCDLLRKDIAFTPMMNVSDSKLIITATACNKTFNVAGLHLSNIIIKDDTMRRKFNQVAGEHPITPFGKTALETAYNACENWLSEVCTQLDANFAFMDDFIQKNLPKMGFHIPQGTYLAWLDIRAYGMDGQKFVEYLAQDAHVIVENGARYGETGEGFIRLNAACPPDLLQEALERIYQSLKKLS